MPPELELCWATKAYQHAEIHFNLLCALPDTRLLKLTSLDDVIYQRFEEIFNGMELKSMDELQLKSESSKATWRDFCNEFKEKVDDFNFATLLRLDASKGYDATNTCIVPRIQFLTIEIARNRRGLNDTRTLQKYNKKIS
ncbi:unnamed protein product [Protopolystoma xenopodis]|uniref:Polysaccharide biosynthesis domain-containing protein n=1 Tax=Protopolystoma xenopodis TaxID=117903 RepID=A0A3S5A502_9PLAT|nr:unnamed protein product [Protopolystoma xenopodis]